jgi:hypothetical protein
MKNVTKLNAVMALGSLTAAAALLAGMPVANAQTGPDPDTSVSGQAVPGGGSFPGSFLVPGTNTSIKIGGFAKGALIYDASGVENNGNNGTTPSFEPNSVTPANIPLNGSANHQLHGATHITARQSQFNFDARTPTAWGELDTYIALDFQGREMGFATQSAFDNRSDPAPARMLLAYGTLGPIMAGQTLSLFFDGDAIGETVDPTASIGVMNGNNNRFPTIRYTYAGAGGLSFAVAAEEPITEGVANGANLFNGASSNFDTAAAGGVNRVPNFVVRGRVDQSWGHAALTGLVRDMELIAPNTQRVNKVGWAVEATGHINTFGKDTLRAQGLYGQGIGSYMSNMGQSAGLEVDSTNAAGGPCTGPLAAANGAGAVAAGISAQLDPRCAGVKVDYAQALGAYLAYTHWWTGELRSTLNAGFEHLNHPHIITANVTQNGLDKTHIGAVLNLIWSPVPQVDFGIEYIWVQRVTQATLNTAGPPGSNTNKGYMNRLVTMAVFKF